MEHRMTLRPDGAKRTLSGWLYWHVVLRWKVWRERTEAFPAKALEDAIEERRRELWREQLLPNGGAPMTNPTERPEER